MQFAESLCRHAAEAVVTTLVQKEMVRLRVDPKVAAEKVLAAFVENFRQEKTLEEDAERLAETHLRTGPAVDRHKVVQMIKQRLAEERKFVL